MQVQQASWSELMSGRNAALVLALSVGVTLHAINIYISTTILPTVVADIGGLHLYAWNTTLFVVASIIGAAVSTRLLQKYGAKMAYALASALVFIGSLLAALAPDMSVMLIGRTLQGAGGGVLLSLGYAVVAQVFDQSLWSRAFALISGMWGMATLFGPAVGGIFAELGIWRGAFAFVLPVTLIYMLFTSWILPGKSNIKTEQKKINLPITQLVLLAAAVLVISIASTSPEAIWNISGVVAALILIALLVWREKTSTTRLLPADSFKSNSCLFAILATMFLLLLAVGCEIYMPYFLQTLHGQSPLFAGYIASLMAAGWAMSELLSARLSGTGAQKAIIGGPIAVLIGMVALSILVPVESSLKGDNLGLLLSVSAGLTLVGFGLGVGWPHLSTLVFQTTSGHDQEIAASAMTTVQMFAAALGAALAGMIANLTGFAQGAETTMSNTELSNTASWLFILFALTSVPAVFSAIKVVQRSPQPENQVLSKSSPALSEPSQVLSESSSEVQITEQ